MPPSADPDVRHRAFLLSPASCAGRRAALLLREEADFPMARAIREPAGAPLGEVFAFLSGLYFRGKLAYARRFAAAPAGVPGVVVITTTRGLLLPEVPVTAGDLREFAAGAPDPADARYREALVRTAAVLAEAWGEETEAVLLGSVATPKYLEPLREVFGERLRYPLTFVGRGDMSRGGLLLRCADAGRELEYAPVDGRPRRGARPPRLAPR